LNIERFIAFRQIKGKSGNKNKLSGPLYRISILAISLSVAVMIVSLSVLDGFQHEITSKVIGFGAHIQLTKYDNNNSFEPQPITVKGDYLKQINKIPGVSKTSLYAIKAGIMKTNDEMEGVILKGVGQGFEGAFFKKNLVAGKLFNTHSVNKNDSILISKKIASKFNLNVHDKVVVYFIQNPARVRKFVISGIYNTGLEDFDNKYFLCDVRHIQRLNNWDSTQFAGIEISINDFKKLDLITAKINEIIPTDWIASSITEQFPQLFDWLKLQDINVQVIIILMTLVAIVNMVTALIILILENTRLIGILKALGMSNAQLQKVFLYQVGVIVGKGLLYGNVSAISLCILQSKFHFITLDETSYYISYVPIQMNFGMILLVNFTTFVVCTLALMLPSRLVAKISPLKAIRYN
jgi:lipoprotein-releasing system permease protein